jgi:hypothetical protein
MMWKLIRTPNPFCKVFILSVRGGWGRYDEEFLIPAADLELETLSTEMQHFISSMPGSWHFYDATVKV